MAKNIEIKSRQNVVEFLRDNHALNMDFVKCKTAYEDGSAKYFFALDNKEGTKGAISRALASEIASNKPLKISDVVVADTVEEGGSDHVWMLMKRGESLRAGGFSISQ